MGRLKNVLRAVLSPRLGIDGSAASSVPPPGHVPIGVETNAAWERGPDRRPETSTAAPVEPGERPDEDGTTR